MPTPHQALMARLPRDAGPVTLRALRPEDIDDFLAYRSDPEVARYQGWQPMDQAAAQTFLADAAPAGWRVGEWAQIGIAQSTDRRLIGDIGLLLETEQQMQIGFSLCRGAQGAGKAHAALTACLLTLLPALGIQKVRAITDERNTPSRRLLSRLGFTETAREALIFRGEACTELTFEASLQRLT